MAYPTSSPYYVTGIVNQSYLDVMRNRPVFSNPTDVYWQITPVYHLRPDLLAQDLYTNANLWWVFAQRNPNRLKDPLFDFVQGTYIFIPKQTDLVAALGI
jgi:hypothetical protein